ncbi:MAG: protein kinase [Gemmataceae bacterium]
MSEPLDPSVTATPAPSSSAGGEHTSLYGGATQSTAAFAPSHVNSGIIPFEPPVVLGEVGTLGPYRIVKELGRGGMGAVFLAFDSRLDRRLAMKVMLPESAAHSDARERFLREARATAKVEHDNVVAIFEASEHNGIPYIAMPFLQGCSLDDYLKKFGNLSISQIVRIGRESAAGLAAAHAKGLIHRDIKPANLWLESPNGRVKVLDFGLARPVATDGELTGTGIVVGTPSFMSPEQGQGVKVDHRTDLFSLGVVLYRLCAGVNPFTGPSVMSILMALGNKEPTPVREANPAVPEALAKMIHQLLAKNPDERPQTAAEVARWFQAFEEHLAGKSSATPAESAQPQVIYVPIPIVAQPESNTVFENLDPTEIEAARSSLRDKSVASKPGGKGMLIGAGVALLLAVVVAGVIVSGMGKSDSPAKQDGTPEPTTEKKDKPRIAPKPPVVVEPDRKAAEYVLSIGGTVTVNNDGVAIENVANLPRGPFTLTTISLAGNRVVTDNGLAACKDCTGLRELYLSQTGITDRGLEHFKNCKAITHLDVGTTEVGNAGLAVFKDCPNLSSLYFSFTKVTHDGLAIFDGRTNIQRLHLGRLGITDKTLEYFKGCKQLHHLHLQETPITDAGLELFKGMDTLTQLNVTSTNATDKGLLLFANCKDLVELWVDYTTITDIGLAPFKNCKNLAYLNVMSSKVTRAMVEEFRKALPDCEIDSDFKKKGKK